MTMRIGTLLREVAVLGDTVPRIISSALLLPPRVELLLVRLVVLFA